MEARGAVILSNCCDPIRLKWVYFVIGFWELHIYRYIDIYSAFYVF